MQTLKSCEIQDLYKHVCYKDLQDYIRKDQLYETLNGLCDTELEKIKNVLGVTSVYVEKVLREYSPNAIANGTVTAALREKADKKDLHSVAFSGNYRELINKPCDLPNPGTLLLKLDNQNDGVIYKGENDVLVNLYEWLTNFLTQHIDEYVTPQPGCDCPITGITVNNVPQTPYCGVVNLSIPLNDLDNYYDKTQIDNRVRSLQDQINTLRQSYNALEERVARLEQGEGVNP